MDNTREKLIELLQDCMCDYVSAVNYEWWTTYEVEYEPLADHLIANGVTVQELDGCEYCNGLPFSQMEDFTMPNASKKEYDIVTIRFCPMCGRKLPQPPKEG